MLTLLLAVFIAISLEPLVVWFTRRGLRRGWAVAIVLTGFIVVLGGFLALVIPPVTREISTLVDAVPGWLQQVHNHHSAIGRLEDRYHLVENAKRQIDSDGGATGLAGGVLGAGQMVLSALTSVAIVITVTLYCMAALPAVKQFCFRFVAVSRRERVEGVTEEIMDRIGKFMLGNLVTSGIAGVATFGWCAAVGVPYAAALGIFTALMDLIPIVGSTLAGIVVSLVALSVSLPIAIATAVFYIVFRVAEDYFIVPRAMRFAVDVHPLVTILAVLVGGALLGIIGAFVAIPAAAAVGLVSTSTSSPRKIGHDATSRTALPRPAQERPLRPFRPPERTREGGTPTGATSGPSAHGSCPATCPRSTGRSLDRVERGVRADAGLEPDRAQRSRRAPVERPKWRQIASAQRGNLRVRQERDTAVQRRLEWLGWAGQAVRACSTVG
ncbi:AI-2E family transporter [Streptomyces sp. NPDC059378]|uniref:AI-2E family transporter n=1 Tax=Streptomyces sp. NPDC059378 TaxID=3346815 RepID=UPI003677B92B